jgi:hypothetical protein
LLNVDILRKKVLELRRALYALPPRAAGPILLISAAAALGLPAAALALGFPLDEWGGAAGMEATDIQSLLTSVRESFRWSPLILGVACCAATFWWYTRRSRREVMRLSVEIDLLVEDLRKQVYFALQEGMSYIKVTYARSWLDLVRHQLERLREEIRQADSLEEQLRWLALNDGFIGDEEDFDAFQSRLAPQLQQVGRDRWVRKFLQTWEGPAEPTVCTVKSASHTGMLSFQSRYFRAPLIVSLEPLLLEPLSLAKTPPLAQTAT